MRREDERGGRRMEIVAQNAAGLRYTERGDEYRCMSCEASSMSQCEHIHYSGAFPPYIQRGHNRTDTEYLSITLPPPLYSITSTTMHLTPRAGVSIAELLIFTPSVLAAIVVCARHGFRRSSGWLHTLILCLVRIVGACCQLLTYHDDSAGLVKATIILDSVGVSPLLLATLGLLSRV